MRGKALIYLSLLSLPVLVEGQAIMGYDTLKLDEVKVFAQRSRASAGYNVTSLDMGSILGAGSSDIGQILAGSTSLFIKNYGPGALSTISFRGTGSGHTIIAWEGIPVTSPMSGTSDLSLLPSLLSGRLSIYEGAASMPLASGAIGGLVNITSDLDWDEKFSLQLKTTAESFGGFHSNARVGVGVGNYQIVTQLYLKKSENNYPFFFTDDDGEIQRERRSGTQFLSNGILTSISRKGLTSVSSLKLWHQSTARGLAPPVVSLQNSGTESQDDSFTRIVATVKGYGEKANYSLSAAWITDNLRYRNSLVDLDSRNLSNTLHLGGAVMKSIGRNTKLSLALKEELNIVESNNYNSVERLNKISAVLTGEQQIAKGFSGHLLVRENIYSGKFLTPDISAGFTVAGGGINGDQIKIMVARNTRLPSLNDLYWYPGGNPDLIAETSRSLELFLRKGIITSNESHFSFESSFYGTAISDMIVWLPLTPSIWQPENIGMVAIIGMDTKFKSEFEMGKLALFNSIGYVLNLSRDITGLGFGEFGSAPQIIYNPRHQANHHLRASFRKISVAITTTYSGKRFTSADNSSFLEPFFTSDLITSLNLLRLDNSIDLSLKVSNLFNREYEMLPYYPLPGRSFHLELKYQFRK